MSKPIVKVSLVRMSEAWYALSPDEQKAFMAKSTANLAAAGGKRILWCDASWSNGEWQFFAVEQFPDMEAVRKHRELQNSIYISRYSHQMFVLGTEA